MFRDGKGRWWLDYYTPDHKRRRKLVDGKTKGDAERALREIRSSVDGGTYADPHRAPGFASFCDTFDERHGQHKASYGKDSARVERLKKYFGDRKLSAITPDMIEQYRLDRIETGKGRDGTTPVMHATINREVMLLRVMLGRAVRCGMLARNPATMVEDYDEGEQRERYLTRAEIRRLLGATKQSLSPLLRPVVYLALETGLRKGELF